MISLTAIEISYISQTSFPYCRAGKRSSTLPAASGWCVPSAHLHHIGEEQCGSDICQLAKRRFVHCVRVPSQLPELPRCSVARRQPLLQLKRPPSSKSWFPQRVLREVVMTRLPPPQ